MFDTPQYAQRSVSGSDTPWDKHRVNPRAGGPIARRNQGGVRSKRMAHPVRKGGCAEISV